MVKKIDSRTPPGQIRLIAGQWKGRKLPVAQRQGLRPTTDRVRETLFNWLAPFIVDAKCLDCFAGSGALGFEALSRHAAQTVFLENDRATARQLLDNAHRLNAIGCEVITTNTLHWLAKTGTPFDIVFIDPPFRQGLINETIQRLEENQWLADEAIIYIEVENNEMDLVLPQHWQLHRRHTAGQVDYRLYRRQK